MTIYLMILGYLGLFSIFELLHLNLKSKQKKVLFGIIAFILFALAGFRYGLEEDYWHYYDIFYGITSPPALEIGFGLINSVVKLLTNSYLVFCIVVAFVSVGTKTYLFSKYKYPFIMLLIYYLRFYVLFELNAIRQGLAMVLVMFAIYSLSEGNKKKFIILNCIAMTIHTSAICGFIALFVNNRKIKLKHIVCLYVFSLLFRLVLFEPVLTYFSPYISYVTTSSNTLIRGTQYLINSWDKLLKINYMSLLRAIVPGICLYIISDRKENMLFFNLYFIGSIMNVMFWGLDTISFRIPAVLYIFEGNILNNGLLKNKFLGHKKRELIFTICVLGLIFCDMWTFTSYLKDSNVLVPYRTVFFK